VETRQTLERNPANGLKMEKAMKRLGYIALIALVAASAFAAKVTEQGTIQDLQPTNFAVAKKQHQQYDFSIVTSSRSYGCRTAENKTLNATDFVVGSTVTFISNGKNGEVKTPQGKSAKCLITRVADTPAR
jgi:hypothetical protein